MSVLRSGRLRLLLPLWAALACAQQRSPSTAADRDDFGDTLVFARPARRIVSLNPATTEIFFALGAAEHLVGRTHYDIYPDSARSIPDLGEGIGPNLEAVLAARPDLVVLYATNANRDAAHRLRAAGVSTMSLRNDHIADFPRTVRLLGRALGDSTRAAIVTDTVLRTLDRVRAATTSLPRVTVFWKAWDTPLLAIGGGSFLSELVDIAGGRNIFADLALPSPQVTLEDVVRRDPQVILTGNEGSSRFRGNPAWRALSAVRDGRILVVDSTVVGRPSVKLGQAAVSIARLLHPGVLP
jgi:iron complex transport system substrate-binding protein